MNAAAIGASTTRSQRERNPPTRLELEERRGEEHGKRLGEHVAGADVRELVREHRLELAGGERGSRPGLTTSVALRGPRPTTNARGKPSSIS